MAVNSNTVGIVVGGGPAPGINGVISAVAIEAIKRGQKVIGIRNGFQYLIEGNLSKAVELGIDDVSRIHGDGGSILFTSRANPKKSPEDLKAAASSISQLGINSLVTIGGDDTASSAWAVARELGGKVAVAHVPKTIDNDLPLPGMYSTFGFQSARAKGTEIVETLMSDAKTTHNRWYLVVAMGRKAGHLALGIGVAAGATLTIVPEDFGEEKIELSLLVDIIVGSILKRLAYDKQYGVVVLAEGMAEKLDLESIPELAGAEKDPHGHIRYAEVDFGLIVKRAVRERLREFGLEKPMVVDKNIGYELRCCSPNAFDREYTRTLGYGVVDFLLSGGSEAMITLQGDKLIPIPFSEMIDAETARSKVRVVDTDSERYRVAQTFMIRLRKPDLEKEELMNRISEKTTMSASEFRKSIQVYE